jgi:hypothetical protein
VSYAYRIITRHTTNVTNRTSSFCSASRILDSQLVNHVFQSTQCLTDDVLDSHSPCQLRSIVFRHPPQRRPIQDGRLGAVRASDCSGSKRTNRAAPSTRPMSCMMRCKLVALWLPDPYEASYRASSAPVCADDSIGSFPARTSVTSSRFGVRHGRAVAGVGDIFLLETCRLPGPSP